jgi:hypothetical protein
MSENNTTNSNTTPTLNTTQTVLAEVASALTTSTEAVKDRIKAVLVEQEVAKRVDLLMKDLTKLREIKSNLNKIRPPVTYTADGTKVEGTYSKADFDNLKKAKEQVAKLEAALEKSFAGLEFDKLTVLVSGGGNSKPETPEAV